MLNWLEDDPLDELLEELDEPNLDDDLDELKDLD